MDVASPNATYELVVKTMLGKGTAIPKGRYTLPKEAKKASSDTVLVFAEGRAADEARQAGADIVGGPELADGVRTPFLFRKRSLMRSGYRLRAADTKQVFSCAHRISSAQSRQNLVACWVLEA